LVNLVQRAAVVATGNFEQHELRPSLGAGQVLLEVVQPLEMRRAADREALHPGAASGAAERFSEHAGSIPASLKLDPMRRTTGRSPS
jgi:hypothetical protein